MKSLSRFISSVRILCCALILQGWLSGAAFSEEQSAKPTPDDNAISTDSNGPPPKILFEQTTVDFGQVAPGSSSSCLFKFCNKGEGVLEISNISTTCGCTVAELEKKKYASGECGEIKVKFNADRATGLRVKHLYVPSNDPLAPKVELSIKAVIAEKAIAEPDKLDYMLKGKDAGHAKITVKSLDGKSFSITKFESTADIVTADFNANQNAPQIELETSVDAGKVGSIINGRIEISITHPDTPVVSVPFSILPRFRTDPPAINIINAEAGKVVQKDLWLLSNYNEDFDITSADSKKGIIKVLNKQKFDKRYKFELEITPPPVKSIAKMFTDTLSVNTKDGEKIDISCRGFYLSKRN
ncbi:MAG: DUF1573 domain-containing protein [Sedimentisphaerales bacterium]|nr:DUF1573 domain-containing protein [Sedimentisphaerales bacterium]